jgi:hypothetical protein
MKKTKMAGMVQLLALMLLLTVPMVIHGQEHANDPAFQKAREETAVITELGRLFGFLLRMDREETSLKISHSQAGELSLIAEEIERTDRFTPKRATAMMVLIEDNILTPAQLIYTDRLFMNRDSSRTGSGSGSGSNPGSSGNPAGGAMAAFIAGGPYNPLRDASRQQGQDFQEFRALVRKRAGS